MAPAHDLSFASDECIPWQYHRRGIGCSPMGYNDDVILDMNARGFQVGFEPREDGTEFLETGYGDSESRILDHDTKKDNLVFTKDAVTVKQTESLHKDNVVFTNDAISFIKEESVIDYDISAKVSVASGKDDPVPVPSKSDTASGSGIFAHMSDYITSHEKKAVASSSNESAGNRTLKSDQASNTVVITRDLFL